MTVLLAALLLTGQAAPPPTSTSPDDDIVVVGERMRRLKLVIKDSHKGNPPTCVLKRRSGDSVLDAQMCDAALTCTAGVTTPNAAMRDGIETCMKPYLDAYLRERVARRKASLP